MSKNPDEICSELERKITSYSPDAAAERETAEIATGSQGGIAERGRADSNSSLPIARSGSSVSTISRCDSRASYASSSGGNRDSIISNSDAPAASATLPGVKVSATK